MATEFVDLLPAIAALADPTRQADLGEVAALIGLSPSRAQRVVSAAIGESPKHYRQRTRVELGAVLLLSTDCRIVDAAFATGFENHETFTRAFVAHFGETPSAWRKARGRILSSEHARIAVSTSRCLTLYNRPTTHNHIARNLMTYDISTQTIDATPIVYQSRRVDRAEVGAVLAECLPAVFGYVMGQGLAPAGHPFVRYTSMSSAFVELDAGVPLVEAASEDPPADTGMARGELVGGLVATTIHKGPYDQLGQAYEAMERWIDASEHSVTGSPWEIYLTDPGEVPNPADWLTEVFFPIA